MILVALLSALVLGSIGAIYHLKKMGKEETAYAFVAILAISAIALLISCAEIGAESGTSSRRILEGEMMRESAKHLDKYGDKYIQAQLIIRIVEFNQHVALAKYKNQSLWYDWFYSDEWNKVEPIPLPGSTEEKKP